MLVEPKESGVRIKTGDARHRTLAFASVAIAVAAGVSILLWLALPRQLHIRTPIVGYPIYAAFNYPLYLDTFYLIALVFPALSIGAYASLVWIGRRVSPTANPRSAAVGEVANPATVAAPREDASESRLVWLAGSLVRLLVPAVAVAIEVAAASPQRLRIGPGSLVALLGYLAIVNALAAALAPVRQMGFRQGLRLVNSYAALAPLVLLTLVSRGSSVLIVSTGHLVHYSWFPVQAAAIALVLAAGSVTFALWRGTSPRRVEIAVVAIVAGGVLVFLCTSALPGALGAFGGFDDAQFLAGAQLTFWRGLLPWRDVYLLHGLIEDDFEGAIGMAVLSHTRWGGVAGLLLFVEPMVLVVQYLCVVYFAWRRWAAIAIVGVLLIAGQFYSIPRFVFLPVIVVAFEVTVRRKGRIAPALLGSLLVIESILTPEIALMAACTVLALLLEGLWANRRTPLLHRFSNLWWASVGAGLTALPFLGDLIWTHSVRAFIDYYRVFGSDHALWGAYPFQWSLEHQFGTTVQFLLPGLLWLATIVRLAIRLHSRRPFSPRDWSLLLSGLFVVSYYQKVIDRLDTGHVYEIFAVATPLMLLWGIEAIAALDHGIARMWRRLGARLAAPGDATGSRVWRRFVAFPLSVAGLAGLAVTLGFQSAVFTTAQNAPGRDHASAPVPAPAGLLGYTVPGSINTGEIYGLGKILARYSPSGPVFDFTNELGLTYFLLNRLPGSRFTHVEEAQTPLAQQLVVSELQASRPRLVVFTDYDFGLPVVDFVTGPLRNYVVSRYILTHYRPLADLDGQLVLIRSDLYRKVPPVRDLKVPGVAGPSRSSYFATLACQMGDIPDFLSAPNPGPTAVTLKARGGTPINTEITGWAVDDDQLLPAREVFATVGGQVVAATTPSLLRPDIEDYYHSAAVADSGFKLDFELGKGNTVHLFALNRDGTVSRIQPDPTLHLPRSLASPRSVGQVRSSAGVYPVQRGAHLSGWINSFTPIANERSYEITVPSGVHLNSFEWAQVVRPGATGKELVTISDGQPSASHSISFNELPGRSSVTAPVGSCLQWYGYRQQLTVTVRGSHPSKLAIRLFP